MKSLRSFKKLWVFGAFGTAAGALVLGFGLGVGPSSASAQMLAAAGGSCGLASPAFCETFDQPAGTGNRSGQMNGTLWGVSRLSGNENFSTPANGWGPSTQTICGISRTLTPDNDIFICNGQLVEGQDDNGTVTTLAMYPKQPFDFAGRTGKVTFDVTNDSAGSHAAWPEFWMSDQPVPAPFSHEATLLSLPRNGFGIRFAGFATGSCPEGAGYVGVDSAITVSNYAANDTFNGGNLQLQSLDCVKQSTGPGQLNHYEVDVSQGHIDVFATDAGSSTLKKIATIANANLSFTRGLIWVEDAHYNGNKFGNQGTHSFTWDNVGFDGPTLPRDLTYDVNDSLTSAGSNDQNNGLGVLNLGWFIQGGTSHTFSVPSVNPAAATGALLTYGLYYQASAPFNLNYTLNGHAHTVTWPYPAGIAGNSPNSIAIPLTLSEVVTGTNTLVIAPAQSMNIFNIDLVMIGAGGGGLTSPPPPPTATPVVPVPTTVPTATVAPTTTTCTVVGKLNGVDTTFTRPMAFCSNQ